VRLPLIATIFPELAQDPSHEVAKLCQPRPKCSLAGGEPRGRSHAVTLMKPPNGSLHDPVMEHILEPSGLTEEQRRYGATKKGESK